MEETTFLVKVNDLHWLHCQLVPFKLNKDPAYLEDLGKLSSSNIGIDVQDLTLGVLGQTSQDRQTSSLDGSFNGSLVNPGDLSDETVFGLVEVFGSENTSRDGSGACTESFKGGGEFEVLL